MGDFYLYSLGGKLEGVPYDSNSTNYPLFHSVEWHRVVLDEGHELDSFSEREEIFSLKAKNRFLTCIQNKLISIFSNYLILIF